ncbi:MAG: hypothetical protein DYH17_16225, partial [Xanthomonadales bacterium PRO6]|nr:hypothetical protein [Xanthomonadales bacterium PRO6]
MNPNMSRRAPLVAALLLGIASTGHAGQTCDESLGLQTGATAPAQDAFACGTSARATGVRSAAFGTRA